MDATHGEQVSTARLWYASTVSALAMLAGCASHPGIGQHDRRSPVDVTIAPWRSLGLVISDVGARCTGVLVAPRAVLTAAHCLYDPATLQLVGARRVQFLLAANEGSHSGHARAVAIVTPPGFSVSRGLRPDPVAAPNADWAVLVLESDIGDSGRTLTLAAGYPQPGTSIAFGGYQVDSGGQLLADTSCTVVGYGRDARGRIMMRHSCAATRGASGGPLLTMGSNGTWLVAGVGSLAENNVTGGWAVPTMAIAEAMWNASLMTGRREAAAE